jgi:hypothetical protein
MVGLNLSGMKTQSLNWYRASRQRNCNQVRSHSKRVEAEPFVVRARDMGLKPGYNFDKVWELIEEIEGPDYK